MSFNNSDWGTDYFDATITSMGHPLTVSIWVKKNATQWGAGGADYAGNMAYNFTADENQIRIFSGQADGANAIWLETGSTQQSFLTFTDGTFDDLWVPIIVRYASATSKQVLIGSTANSGNINTSSRDLTLLDSFRLGRLMAGFGGFEGKIAEVTLWDKSLSDAEVDEINPTSETGPAGNTIASGDCVGYWPLDTDLATQVDESGTANGSFVEVGTRTFDSDHPTITAAGNPHYYYDQQ